VAIAGRRAVTAFLGVIASWGLGDNSRTCLGFVVSLLAWRRLVSDAWPGAKPDPESCTTTLGPLTRQYTSSDLLSSGNPTELLLKNRLSTSLRFPFACLANKTRKVV